MTRKLILAVFVAALAFGCDETKQAPRLRTSLGTPTNLILFTVDTLRADHLGVYGYTRSTSPALDAFAVDAVVFDQAQSPRGLTWPSLTTAMSGLEIHDHGVRINGEQPSANLRTVATSLADSEFVTAAFLTNACHLQLPGFAQWRCFTSEQTSQIEWDRVATEAAIGFLEQIETPFFLWLHLMDPHFPYECTEETEALFVTEPDSEFIVNRWNLVAAKAEAIPLSEADHRHVIDRYDCGVRHADDRFAELLDAVTRMNLAATTAIVVSADHGEELADHAEYYFHSSSVYQASLRVPLVIRHPAQLEPGRRVAEPVGLVDLAPTLVELAGIDAASLGPGIDGNSFASAITDAVAPARRLIRGEIRDRVVVLRDGPLKYATLTRGGSHAGTIGLQGGTGELLFDLDIDPDELVSLSRERPTQVRRMRILARQVIDESGWRHVESERDPQVVEQLRGLGYVGN